MHTCIIHDYRLLLYQLFLTLCITLSLGDDEEYVMMNNPPVQHQYDYMTPDTDVQSPLQQPSVQNVPQQNEHRMFRSPSVVSDTGSVMSNSDTKEQMYVQIKKGLFMII